VKEIEDYRSNSRTLDAVVEHHTMDFLLLRDNGADRVKTAVVSANFFAVLGVRPAMGRTFVAADEAHSAEAVLILSHEYWQAHHAGDPRIVGKVFQMNNRPHTVIGVLPAIPQYPVESDVYMPISQCPTRSSEAFIQNRRGRMMTAFGRLKPGVSTAQAQSDLSVVAGQMAQGHPDVYPPEVGYSLQIGGLRQELTKRARGTFLVLLGVAGLVLLIACANVANLLLARLLKLEPELALRTALGATKTRLVRQLLTESLLLSSIGGAIGLAVAPLAVRMLVSFAGRFTSRASEVSIDAPVMLFALALSLAAGVLFGLGPAFLSSTRVAETIKRAGARASGGQRWFRSGLVVAQVAVSFILLIGAGLMMRSFQRLQQVSPGFNPNRVLTMRLGANFSRYTTQQQYRTLFENLLRQVHAVPGV
jgi:predicted permease